MILFSYTFHNKFFPAHCYFFVQFFSSLSAIAIFFSLLIFPTISFFITFYSYFFFFPP